MPCAPQPSPPPAEALTVDGDVLATVAAACRDHEPAAALLYAERRPRRRGWRGHRRGPPRRAVPACVHQAIAGTLLAWDLERDDWRTFRVDRLRPSHPRRPIRAARVSEGGAAAHVLRSVGARPGPSRLVRYHVPAEVLAGVLTPPAGLVTPEAEAACVSRSIETVHDLPVPRPPRLAVHRVDLPALKEVIAELAERFADTARPDASR